MLTNWRAYQDASYTHTADSSDERETRLRGPVRLTVSCSRHSPVSVPCHLVEATPAMTVLWTKDCRNFSHASHSQCSLVDDIGLLHILTQRHSFSHSTHHHMFTGDKSFLPQQTSAVYTVACLRRSSDSTGLITLVGLVFVNFYIIIMIVLCGCVWAGGWWIVVKSLQQFRCSGW